MKKISILMAVLCSWLAFSSCEDDKEPVYKAPTEFVLNTPPLQDQLLTLTPEGTFELTCSQPDYGYSAVTEYSVDASLTADFAKFENIRSTGTATTARMVYKDEDLAIAIGKLHGYNTKDDYVDNGPEKIYFRAVAQLAGVESSRIVSNVVSLNKVQSYYAVKEPGRIYVVGSFGSVGGIEWNVDGATAQQFIDAHQILNETGVETGIYTGVVTFASGQTTFRFYTELGDWGDNSELPSIGANPVDGDLTEVSLSANAITVPATYGKGSWQTQTDFAGGPVTMMFDMNKMELTLTAGEAEIVITNYVYMVGNQAGWAEPSADNEAVYDNWRLADSSSSGIYTGTFDLSAMGDDDLYCRFYQKLTGWGAAQWASSASDNVIVTSGVPCPTVEGEGCFELNGAKGKTVTVSLDTNNNTVTFTME